MPTQKYYIESSPGIFDVEVAASSLTNKVPGAVAHSQPVPFALSANIGEVNRTQGISGSGGLNHQQFFYCQFDRVANDAAGRSETLAQLANKGHTVFYFNQGQEINTTSDYASGYAWMSYGNSGTNNAPYDFDHNPGLTLRTSLNDIYNRLNAIIVPRGPELKYMVANFEFYDFLPGSGSNPNLWDNVTNKNDSFYSPFDGQNHTLQELYNQGGLDLLNMHLHAKRMQLNTLWMYLVKEKNPGCLVCSGDAIPFQQIDINGEFITSQGTFLIKNYKSIPYSAMREWIGGGFNGFRGVPGGNVSLGGKTYNLSGVECEHWDFFVHYYYYQEVFCKASDYNDMMNSNDPAKNTLDYWQSKFWFSRHHIYLLPTSHELRTWFLPQYAQNGGKDMTNMRVFDMNEHMIEANQTYLTGDGSSQTYPSNVNYNQPAPPPFMKWIPSSTPAQKMYIHKELIWTRQLQAAMCYTGKLVWWEVGPNVNYASGKWQYFHQRSQEEHQKSRDYLRQYEDLWGPGSTLTMEGIQFRYRRNGGSWTSFAPSPAPVQAWFGTSQYQPFILKRTMPNVGRFYTFHVGQEDTDVLEIEFIDAPTNKTFTVQLTGCMPQARAIRDL